MRARTLVRRPGRMGVVARRRRLALGRKKWRRMRRESVWAVRVGDYRSLYRWPMKKRESGR
jgi:hypothetical protein